MSPRQPVWLDCDPGHDDAMAVILAGHSPAIELLGVSTVAGNQTLEKVTQNALDILHAAGLGGIDVVPGQRKPIMRPAPLLCPEIHGETGLDGPKGGRLLPKSCRDPLQGKAVNVMAQRISDKFEELGRRQRVKLVCTGALTNAALLLSLYPELIEAVEVVIMGGCMGVGNTGPVVEFNIQTDPEAAHMVFESGVPLVMVPLEVTHTVCVTPKVLVGVRGGGPKPSAFRHAVQQLLLFFKDTYREVFKFVDPPLHDPCAVAYVIAPHLFEVQEMRVDIETASPLSCGQTVCDVWGQSRRPKNCHVALKVDVEAFWELMLDALAAADAVSPLNGAAA